MHFEDRKSIYRVKCYASCTKGRVQKNMENSIKGPDPPPLLWKNFSIFFLKLDHFLRTFCKKCIFTIENPKFPPPP